MNVYRYKAVDDIGKKHTGTLDAANPDDLDMRLKKIGFDLIHFKTITKPRTKIGGSHVKRRDLITFFFHLEHTSKAGVPILESLADLRDSTDNPRLQEIFSALYEAIEGGATLSEAMSAHPAVFNEVITSLVRAGELSGGNSRVFAQLAADLKWQDEQVSLTRRLIMYPLFVGIVVVAVIFFLMTYLIPELLKFIQSVEGEIPTHTKALIFVSNIFVNYGYLLVAVPLTICAALIAGIKTSPAIRYRVDALKLKLPIVGPILKKIILARLANSFAIMYSSGITILDCLKASDQLVGNRAIREAIHGVGLNVSNGISLSGSFESARLFPPLVLRMLRVGESTGALHEALLNINYFYTRDAKESIERLQSMIEPGLTLILGGLIAWVMFSVLGPIYDLITKIRF